MPYFGPMDPNKPHHHGDLRNALIQAGIALLTEGGAAALTLRKCAARAGVSHAAPTHHFEGLPGLKAEIAHEGLRMFRDYMLAAAAAAPATPRGQLKGICRGYLTFAQENRALFNLVFGFDALEMQNRGMTEENSLAYQVLRQACAPFVPPDTDRTVIEAQVWSLIHGFTTLALSGRFNPAEALLPDPFDQVMALLDRIGAPQTP